MFASFAIVPLLALSGLQAYDRTTWVLEIFPIAVALPILWVTYRRFPLTNLVYGLIFLHACVLMVGGTYTYARVPFGFQLAEWLSLSRNPYDKVGHFFQGFVPALIAREILVRGQYVRGKKMLRFIVISIVLAISATYELIEWGVAIAIEQGAYEFLGTQGDEWDTQSDMLLALIGATTSLALFSRIHDRQIVRIQSHGN
ncbi:putative membrane protein [Methyloglobulus morosus KoM1]|uniref:Putative membrane protein n=2 Tax=Methyloglobulus TaxID=1410680 RepID=V5BGY7_9GAMM|nr:putative membrane protein [Methyloglobulus morosus KoM1]